MKTRDEITKAQQDRIQHIHDSFAKGKELPIGTVRTHGGVEMKKTGPALWVPVKKEGTSESNKKTDEEQSKQASAAFDAFMNSPEVTAQLKRDYDGDIKDLTDSDKLRFLDGSGNEKLIAEKRKLGQAARDAGRKHSTSKAARELKAAHPEAFDKLKSANVTVVRFVDMGRNKLSISVADSKAGDHDNEANENALKEKVHAAFPDHKPRKGHSGMRGSHFDVEFIGKKGK